MIKDNKSRDYEWIKLNNYVFNLAFKTFMKLVFLMFSGILLHS